MFLDRPGLPVDDVVAVDHAVDRRHVLQRGARRLDKRRHEAELDAVPLEEGILQGRVAEKVLRAVVLNGARCGLMRAVRLLHAQRNKWKVPEPAEETRVSALSGGAGARGPGAQATFSPEGYALQHAQAAAGGAAGLGLAP